MGFPSAVSESGEVEGVEAVSSAKRVEAGSDGVGLCRSRRRDSCCTELGKVLGVRSGDIVLTLGGVLLAALWARGVVVAASKESGDQYICCRRSIGNCIPAT